VELATAFTVAAVVILGVIAILVTHIRAYHNQKLLQEMHQNVRFATDAMARDLRMAGYGISVPDSELAQWIPWATGITSNPSIAAGASASDPYTLTVVGAFDPPIASLAASASAGSTNLYLNSGEGAQFDDWSRRVLHVGRCETARVVSRSGDLLTISVDPLLDNKGLLYDHPVGTCVELVKVVSYTCHLATNLHPARTFLLRDDSYGISVQNWEQAIAGHIENLRASNDFYTVTLQVTGRTSEPTVDYVDQAMGDSYRRMAVATRVIPRNSPLLGIRH